LTDLVHGRAGDADVARGTVIPQLRIVTAGTETATPQGLFQLPAFRDCIQRWTSDNAYVVFDSAPFGAVAESLSLALVTSGVVLVVEAARTARDSASELIDDLRDSGVRMLGAVLNKRKLYVPEWIYRRV
jgi:Mrp family chromosome partitioning ATPase